MNQAHPIQLLVTGKALVRSDRTQRQRRDRQVAFLVAGEGGPTAQNALQLRQAHRPTFTPGIETERLDFRAALVGDHCDAAQMVLMQVSCLEGARTARRAVGVGHNRVATHRVALFGIATGRRHFLVQPAHVYRRGGIAAIDVASCQ